MEGGTACVNVCGGRDCVCETCWREGLVHDSIIGGRTGSLRGSVHYFFDMPHPPKWVSCRSGHGSDKSPLNLLEMPEGIAQICSFLAGQSPMIVKPLAQTYTHYQKKNQGV